MGKAPAAGLRTERHTDTKHAFDFREGQKTATMLADQNYINETITDTFPSDAVIPPLEVPAE